MDDAFRASDVCRMGGGKVGFWVGGFGVEGLVVRGSGKKRIKRTTLLGWSTQWVKPIATFSPPTIVPSGDNLSRTSKQRSRWKSPTPKLGKK